MCFLYVFLQIAVGLKNFPTKVAFFLHVFFVCVSSNCLRPGKFSHGDCTSKFSHKSCNFFFITCVFLYMFLQIAFGSTNFPTKIAILSSCGFCTCFFKLPSVWKVFPQSLHLKIFPQKLQFF